MADLPLSHVRLTDQDVAPLIHEIACESGDSALVTLTSAGDLLISLDDVDRTLAGPDGEPRVPTVKLTHREAADLVRWLEWALRRPGPLADPPSDAPQ